MVGQFAFGGLQVRYFRDLGATFFLKMSHSPVEPNRTRHLKTKRVYGAVETLINLLAGQARVLFLVQ